MLHVLTLAYFAALFSGAALVVAGTLLGNRALIMRALGLREAAPALLPPISAARPAARARVVRMASPAPVLRLAA